MSEQTQPSQPSEDNLLIELIFKRSKKIFWRNKYWIQNRPYKFGLKIKNVGEKGSSEAQIKRLTFRSAEGVAISQSHTEEFTIPKLNPGQEIDLWWPDPTATVIKGSAWLDCIVTSLANNTRIRTYQADMCTKKPQPYDPLNRWGYGFAIRGELEEEQSRTNFLLAILTALMFLDGVWGLNVLSKFLINNLGWLFSAFGSWLSHIG